MFLILYKIFKYSNNSIEKSLLLTFWVTVFFNFGWTFRISLPFVFLLHFYIKKNIDLSIIKQINTYLFIELYTKEKRMLVMAYNIKKDKAEWRALVNHMEVIKKFIKVKIVVNKVFYNQLSVFELENFEFVVIKNKLELFSTLNNNNETIFNITLIDVLETKLFSFFKNLEIFIGSRYSSRRKLFKK